MIVGNLTKLPTKSVPMRFTPPLPNDGSRVINPGGHAFAYCERQKQRHDAPFLTLVQANIRQPHLRVGMRKHCSRFGEKFSVRYSFIRMSLTFTTCTAFFLRHDGSCTRTSFYTHDLASNVSCHYVAPIGQEMDTRSAAVPFRIEDSLAL